MNLYEPTKKFLILSIVAALVSLAGITTITWVLFSKISMINQEVAKTNLMNVSVERAFKIKGQLNEAETKLKTLDSFFLQPAEEVKFIEQLEAIATSTKVKLDIQSISIDSKDKSNQEFKEDMSIQLLAEGERANLLAFLKSLETASKAVSVNKADLVRSEESWNLRLSIVAYRLK